MACWSREFTAEFIDLYRSQESVWNVKSKEYTDRSKKAKGYELLVAKVQTVDRNATRDTVVKKINCLRSSFRKEVKKVVKSKQAGDGQVYVPRLWYYTRLAFLEGQELPRDSKTDNEEDEDVEDKELVNEPDVECETLINVKRPPSPADESSASSIPVNDVTRRLTKRRKCSHHQQQQHQQHSVQQQDNSYVELITEDRFDIFGKIVAGKLRSLPNEQRIYAEKLINDVLFEAELNTLGRGCHIAVPRTIEFPSGNSGSVCG